MIDSTNPRILADNIRHLSGESGSQASDISSLQTTVTAQGNAIEALQIYDDAETDTGMKWIDGKSIYRKIIAVDELPNNTTLQVDHGITDLGEFVFLSGVTTKGVTTYPITYGGGLIYRLTSTKINIQTNSDWTEFGAYFILEYTKSAAPSPDLAPAPDDTRSIEPEPEVRESEEPVIDEPIEEPIQEVKKTTRKKSTN